MTNLEKGKYYIVYSSNDCNRCLKFEEMLEPTARFTDFKGTIVITALKSFTGNKIDYSVSPGLISFVRACKLTGMFITPDRLAAQELSKMFRCEIRDNEIFFIYKGDILPMEDYFNRYIEKEIPLYTLDGTGRIIDAEPFKCCESLYKPQPITSSTTEYINQPIIIYNSLKEQAHLKILQYHDTHYISTYEVDNENFFLTFDKDKWDAYQATVENVLYFKLKDIYLRILNRTQLSILCKTANIDVDNYSFIDLTKNATAVLHNGTITRIIDDDTLALSTSCERYFTEVKSTNLTINDCGDIILMNNKEEKKMKGNKYLNKIVSLYATLSNKHIGYGLLISEDDKEFKIHFEPIHSSATYHKNFHRYEPASVYYIKARDESICFAFEANKHNLDILKSCWKTFEELNIKEDNDVHYLMVKNGLWLSSPNDSHTHLVMNRYGYLDYIDLNTTRDTFVTKSYLTSLNNDIKELSKFDIANFHTTEGVRYESGKQYKNLKGGKQINTITTHISYKGKEATATIDADDYDERQGILEC